MHEKSPSTILSEAVRLLKRLGIYLSTIVCLVGFSGPTLAADMNVTPSIRVQETYDDNVTFSRSDEQDDYLTSINPSLTLHYATALLDLESDAAVDVLRYADDSDLDTENYHLGIKGGYRLTERFTLSGNFSYLKDTTLESELEETGLVNVREDRDRYTGGAGLSYQISERSDVGMEYTYMDTKYDFSGQVDYHSNRLVLSHNRYFNNQRDTFTIQPYYSQYDSDRSQTDNYGLSLGWAHAFSERLRLSAFLGARYTDTDSVIPRGALKWDPIRDGWVLTDLKMSDTNWSGVANISMTKTGETTSATLGYTRDLYYDSSGEPIETDRLYVNADRRITKRLDIGFSGSLYFTESEGAISAEDSRHFELSPHLSYRLTEHHFLRMRYSYAHHYDKTLSDDEDYDRQRIWIAFRFHFPEKWAL